MTASPPLLDPLPRNGRQWTWGAEKLARKSINLPPSLIDEMRRAANWRDIPVAALERRAVQLGWPLLKAIIEQEDAVCGKVR